jgi:dethiobiotin synthetase
VEAIERTGLSCAGLVIGAWPRNPGAAETYNRGALQRLAPLRAVLPAGCAALSAQEFADVSRQAFDPAWVRRLV